MHLRHSLQTCACLKAVQHLVATGCAALAAPSCSAISTATPRGSSICASSAYSLLLLPRSGKMSIPGVSVALHGLQTANLDGLCKLYSPSHVRAILDITQVPSHCTLGSVSAMGTARMLCSSHSPWGELRSAMREQAASQALHCCRVGAAAQRLHGMRRGCREGEGLQGQACSAGAAGQGLQ